MKLMLSLSGIFSLIALSTKLILYNEVNLFARKKKKICLNQDQNLPAAIDGQPRSAYSQQQPRVQDSRRLCVEKAGTIGATPV